jgi:fructose-1-phosphate kinase PfkB-like protein
MKLDIPVKYRKDIELATNLLKKEGCQSIYLVGLLVTGKNHEAAGDSHEAERDSDEAAGDSFAGGFLHGLLEGWSPETAAVFASAVASHNVTRIGATGGVPDFETAYAYVVEHAGGEGRFPLKL